MAKLTLNPAPTFKAPVPIPVPGQPPVDIVFVFNYKDREQLEEFTKNPPENDVDGILEICSGWEEVEQEFCRESVELLDRRYMGAARSVFETYLTELRGARVKN